MDFEQSIPQYTQIAETISRRIADGYFASDSLPPARELEKDFGVSEITIRKALRVLVEKGDIVRKRGLGTMIVQRRRLQRFDYFGNFRELMDTDTGKPVLAETQVLDVTTASFFPLDVRLFLLLKPEDTVRQIRRLRRHNGEAVSYFINYGRTDLLGRIQPEDLRENTFVQVAAQVCGIKFMRMEQWVEVTTADFDLAALLGTKFGKPLFFAKNHYFNEANEPVAISHMYFRGDKYKYFRTEDMTDQHRPVGR